VRVLCTLPNAGESINGVPFAEAAGGRLSDPLSPEVAAAFLRIPGYVGVKDGPEPGLEPDPPPDSTPPKRGPGRPPKSADPVEV
jgi:hypothetical protein